MCIFPFHYFLFQIEEIISKINQNILALPFLHQSDQGSVDGISKRVRENVYKTSDEVIADLQELFHWKEAFGDKELTLISNNVERKLFFRSTELEKIASKMRKNLALWVKEAFAASEAGEEMTEKAGQIFENLVRKFPHVRQEELKVKSRLIAQENKEDIWKTIVAKLEERNRNQDPNAAYKRFRLNPKNQDDNNDEHLEHFYVAAFHFHKMALKWTDSRTSNPLPLRTISRPEESIDHAEMGKCINSSLFLCCVTILFFNALGLSVSS